MNDGRLMLTLQTVVRRAVDAVRNDAVFSRLLKNSGWLLGSNAVIAGLSFAQSILLVRLLGVELYGVWAMITVFVSTAYQLVSFRIGEFIVKYLSEAIAEKRRDREAAIVALAYVLSSITGLLALGVVWGTAPIAAQWLAKDMAITSLFSLYAWTLVAGLATEVSVGVLQVYSQFQTIALLNVLKSLLLLGGMSIVVWFHGGLSEIIVAVLVGTAFHGIAVHTAGLRQLRQRFGSAVWAPSFEALRGDFRSIGKFLVSSHLSAFVSVLTKESDILWLAFFRNPTEVGLYRLAYSLARLVMMPIKPLAQTTYREIARSLARADVSTTIGLLKKGSVLAAVWVIPVSVGLVLVSPVLISSLYGPALLPATPALAILLVGLAFANIFFWNRPVLLSLGLATFLVKVSIVVGILKLGLVFVLVPAFGYIGNAVLLSLLYFTGVGLAVWKAFQQLSRKRNVSNALSPMGRHVASEGH